MLEVLKCPACGDTYSPPTQFCLQDGTQLEVARTLIGRVLDDRYRIESLIGEGGMGTVYCGTHIQLDDKIAVKVLHPEMINNDNAIKRFRQEARAARLIQHQNAAQVTDFGVTADNLVYLVMEFVEGRNLRELMRGGEIEYHQAAKLLFQICDAIEAAHQKGIIHRDLKPENIMVKDEGGREIVKVLDFGIAKLLEDDAAGKGLTKAGTIMGTPQYMSPEQCQGKNIGTASDIYSIGVIAYEMLSGAPPFTGDCASDYFVKHLHIAPAQLLRVAPQVPEILALEIMQALEKNPAERQQTASDLGRRLRIAVRKADGGSTTDPYKSLPGSPPEDDIETRDLPGEVMDQFERSRGKAVVPVRITNLIDTGQEVRRPPDRQPAQDKLPVGESNKDRKRSKAPLIGAVAVGLLVLAGAIYWLATQKISPPPPSGMVLIKGGKFMMGRNDGETDEKPAHEVTVNDFFFDKYEVTNQQYKKCVDAKQCIAPRNWKNGVYEPDDALLPVTFVTWGDAAAYARWAGKRLPKEAEWEYVARGGGKTTLYPWGDQWKDRGANVGRGGQRPLPGGSFDSDQSVGVFDLIGNVSEWVQDSYNFYDGGTIRNCPNCKVYRGGSFRDRVEDSTAIHRFAWLPAMPTDPRLITQYENDVAPLVGFRCAMDAK